MWGVFVAGAARVTRTPSVHYGAHLVTVATPFADLVRRLIDGEVALPDGKNLVVMPVSEDADYSRLVAMDRSPGVGDRCFVIDVWSRTGDDARGDWDPRGKPRLLDDVVDEKGQWHIYNCLVALRPWSRKRASKGEYPDA